MSGGYTAYSCPIPGLNIGYARVSTDQQDLTAPWRPSPHCASIRSDGYRPMIDITRGFLATAAHPYRTYQTRSEL
jgi:hypothetical protein